MAYRIKWLVKIMWLMETNELCILAHKDKGTYGIKWLVKIMWLMETNGLVHIGLLRYCGLWKQMDCASWLAKIR